jgi:transcriptional/translational regulatory protein YebC/TACO1
VLCAQENFEAVNKAMQSFSPESAEIVMRPGNRVAVDAETAQTLHDLLEWLEELDDVQDVYHNAAV